MYKDRALTVSILHVHLQKCWSLSCANITNYVIWTPNSEKVMPKYKLV